MVALVIYPSLPHIAKCGCIIITAVTSSRIMPYAFLELLFTIIEAVARKLLQRSFPRLRRAVDYYYLFLLLATVGDALYEALLRSGRLLPR